MSEFAREELERVRPSRDTVLTVGNFDGVHLGHRALVEYVIGRARELGLAAGVVTLYPDPDRVLRPQEPMRYITSLEERLELLRGLGLDIVVPLTFTSELAEIAPDSFARLLREEMRLRLLIMGPGNAFGRNREGTPQRMQVAGAGLGFECEVLPQGVVQQAGLVSATAIRAALAEGDLPAVERQLGRRYALRGPVVKGDQRGRLLGFPTANVGVTADRALPAFGVYATWAYVGEERYASATNVGMRPTFDGVQLRVEAHLLGFAGDLYDRQLRLEFVERLRPEMKFDGVDAIKAQIDQDVAKAAQILSAST
jgi:riboflavin kinase/FMN adenylyltransferase